MNVLTLFGKSKNEVALRQDVDEILSRMEALTIENAEQFTETAEFLKGIKGKTQEVKNYFEDERAKKYSEYKAVTTKISTYTDPLGKAEKIVKRKLGDYRTEQERKRREEEQRKLAELKAQAEDQLLDDAEANGDESILDEELMIAKPELETEVPAMKGISFTTVWHFQIVDAKQIPRDYMMPDEKKIGDVVKALKDKANIPGIRVFSEQQVGARSA